MIPLEEARSRVLDATSRLGPEHIGIAGAAGAVAAQDVASAIDVPPFPNSAMDGYAVCAEDVVGADESPVTLPVVTISAAGHPPERPIERGEAARILTGAPMVGGADAVVPVEATDAGDERVVIRGAVAAGTNVRAAGDDVDAGDLVVASGTRLRTAHIGLLASCGLESVAVYSAPRVAIVVTGDELVPPGRPLGPGQIYESNGVVLAELVRAATGGHSDPRPERLPDDAERVRERLTELSRAADLVISSGGVSMGGEYDVVKVAFAALGVEFWQVAIKPAKPMAFGRLGQAVFIGVPGNPVSAQVSFELFARPVLRKQMGIEPPIRPTREARAGEAFSRRDDGKTHLMRVEYDAAGHIVSAGKQFSHVQSAMAAADALAVIPADRLEVASGEVVDVIDLGVQS